MISTKLMMEVTMPIIKNSSWEVKNREPILILMRKIRANKLSKSRLKKNPKMNKKYNNNHTKQIKKWCSEVVKSKMKSLRGRSRRISP